MATVYFTELNGTQNKAENKQNASLIANAIVKHIALNTLNIPEEKFVILKEKNGKPYLKDFPDFCFNISHSGNAVAVAFSEKPIGVDIEKLRKADLRVAERFYTEAEKAYISENLPETDKRFFEIWTKKEAYIKKNGLSLKDLKKAQTDGIFTSEINEYIISVCCESEENIEIIPFSDQKLTNIADNS